MQSHGDLIASLAEVLAVAEAEFADTNPGRVEQLRGALATASMAIDALHTEVPYVSTESP